MSAIINFIDDDMESLSLNDDNNKYNDRYVVVSIDIGVVNLGFCAAFVKKDFMLDEIFWIDLIDITKFKHTEIKKQECKLNHTKTFSDWIDHFIQENYQFFEQADFILLENQPPQGFKVVEQILFSKFRSKCHLISPIKLHKFLNINHLVYEDRKIETIKTALKLLSVPELIEQFHYYNRKHDIADAICILLYWIKNKTKEYYKQQNQDYVNSIDFNHKSLNKWFSQFKYK